VEFDVMSAALEKAARETDGVNGLVLLGSAADASRRDEWSDHDFFVMLTADRLDRRADLSWLPESDRLVLTAYEGEVGRAAIYDDGHVFEFAAAMPEELTGAKVNAHLIVYDEGELGGLIDAALKRPEKPESDPVNDARLILVKLLIGVGRIRRGEVLSGARFVRAWAVSLLVKVIWERIPAAHPELRDDLDELRRFERSYPMIGLRIEDALALPAEASARAIFDLSRELLEPDWPEFPSAAADAVARRLGWVGPAI
jgi:hypothetical protein